jgi:hypothetical protein
MATFYLFLIQLITPITQAKRIIIPPIGIVKIRKTQPVKARSLLTIPKYSKGIRINGEKATISPAKNIGNAELDIYSLS